MIDVMKVTIGDLVHAFEGLDVLGAKIDHLTEIVERHAAGKPEYFGLEDVHERFGLSRRTIQRRPWLMPRWGVSDISGIRAARWSPETWYGWFATPPDEREAQWKAMSPAERNEALQ